MFDGSSILSYFHYTLLKNQVNTFKTIHNQPNQAAKKLRAFTPVVFYFLLLRHLYHKWWLTPFS